MLQAPEVCDPQIVQPLSWNYMQDEVASTRCSCFSFGSRRGAKTCDNGSARPAAQPRRHDAEQPMTREKERKVSMSAAPQN